MNGAGFMRHMIDSFKSNRAPLKGKKQATYQNFDKSYITDWIVSRKVPKFKETTPEQIEQIRIQMTSDRKSAFRKRMTFLTLLILSGGFLFWYLIY